MPYTAGNFLDLVESGFYNGLTFHRVENWVIQGGDPNGNGSGCATDPNTGAPKYLKLETNPRLNHNQPGMVAMARSNDPNSASCQFYILKSAMPQLNGKYAVFGKVVEGLHTVYAIRPGDRITNSYILHPAQDTATNSIEPAQQQQPQQQQEQAPSKPVRRDSGF